MRLVLLLSILAGYSGSPVALLTIAEVLYFEGASVLLVEQNGLHDVIY